MTVHLAIAAMAFGSVALFAGCLVHHVICIRAFETGGPR